MRNKYGYVRVSSVVQKEDRQMQALKGADAASNHIWMDKPSGKDFSSIKQDW